MKYTNVNIEFLPHNFPEIEERVRQGCEFLEIMVNSQMFKDFVLEGKYIDELSNQGVYDKFTQGDIHMVFSVQEHDMADHRIFSVNKTSHIISVYKPQMHKFSTPELAATIAHEYGHTIDFHHKEKYAGTFSFYVQFEGAKLFRKFYRKMKKNLIPRKGMWLTYEPVWIFWFWKRLKWRPIKD